MYNSSRNIDSPQQHRRHFIHTPNKISANDIPRKLIPKMTSTPISPTYWKPNESNFCGTPTIKPLINRTRYSLSDTTLSGLSSNRENSHYVQNTSGPLLASTHFLNNIGTYMDSKSPGLSSRVVQYNESESKATHQAKYNKPGVFPIVHLFKKDVPVLSPRQRRVTVRVATSDLCLYNRPEHNKLLLEGVLQDPVNIDSSCQNSVENDTGTRSVLEALKEISRKRIHSSEQLDGVEDTRKKQRKEYQQVTKEQNKQAKDNNPKNTSSATNSTTCVIDPITASLTSASLYYGQLAKGVKRKAESTESNSQKQEKQIKLLNAETQTVDVAPGESDNDSPPINSSVNKNKEEVEHINSGEKEEIKEPAIFEKIFDDKPLEVTRRNRLAVLLGALAGEKPQLIPVEDRLQTFSGTPEKSLEVKKTPVSIISPQNKLKHDKHVTFNVTETADTKTSLPTSESNMNVSKDYFKSITNSISTTVPLNSISSTTKISSESDVLPLKVPSSSFSTSTTIPSNPLLRSSVSEGMLALQPTTNISVSSSASSSLITTTATAVSTPVFTFNKSEELSSSNVIKPLNTSVSTSNTTTAPEVGGFKFNLPLGGGNKLSSTPSEQQIVSNGPSNSVTNSTLNINTSGNLFDKTVASSSPFIPITTKSLFSSGVAASSTFSVTSKSDSNLNSYQFSTNPKASVFSLPTTSSTAFHSDNRTGVSSMPQATPNVTNFGAAVTTSNSVLSMSQTTASATSFGAAVATSTFVSSMPQTTPSATSFGAAVTTSTSVLSMPQTTPSATSFGVTVTTPNTLMFGATPSETFSFKTSSMSTTSSVAPTFTSLIAKNPVSVASDSQSQFGTNKPFSFINTTATDQAKVSLNSTISKSFGNATASSIFTAPISSSGPGANTTVHSGASTFGGNVASSSSSDTKFQSIFSTSTNIFGTNAATTSAPKVSTVSTPVFQFGTTTSSGNNSVFGAASSSSKQPAFEIGKTFGSDTTLAFGANTKDISASNSFGTLSGNSFGSGTSTFGGGSTSLFGSNMANNLNTQKPDSSKGFASSAPFSLTSNKPIQQKQEGSSEFGTAFTSNVATPAFNNASAPNAFQLNDTQKLTTGFGSTATNTTFGKPQVTINSFMPPSNSNFHTPVTAAAPFGGTSSNVFGTSNVNQSNSPAFSFTPASQSTFAFGASGNVPINTPTNKVFSFGATEPPKSNDLNFSGHTSALGSGPAFGMNATPSVPTFGNTFSPQFSAPTAGTFSIGSGTTSSRSRTQLKAKRRT